MSLEKPPDKREEVVNTEAEALDVSSNKPTKKNEEILCSLCRNIVMDVSALKEHIENFHFYMEDRNTSCSEGNSSSDDRDLQCDNDESVHHMNREYCSECVSIFLG